MAEFVEVMRNCLRMCESYSFCFVCPAFRLKEEGGCMLNDSECLEEAEKIAIKWATKHPAPDEYQDGDEQA